MTERTGNIVSMPSPEPFRPTAGCEIEHRGTKQRGRVLHVFRDGSCSVELVAARPAVKIEGERLHAEWRMG